MITIPRRCRFCCLLIAGCLLTASTAAPTRAGQLGDMPVIKEFAAGMRAIAAMDPDEKIRNPDTLARHFLSPAFWFWTALDEDYDKSKQFISFYRVSAYYTQNACTQHIDGILQAGAKKGIEQVVIIGAGLDSRAYRFQQQMPSVRFFEVDLPAAVSHKQELIRTAVGKPPETVAFVPADYRNGEMAGALKAAGHKRRHKTLFIWEGGTPYTDAKTVDGTIQFITSASPPGSELVFDYIFDDIARGDFSNMPWARFQSVRVAVHGFPWKFGIASGKAGEFVSSRGLKVISDVGPGDLARRYLVRSDGSIDGKPTPYFRIMHAVVKN